MAIFQLYTCLIVVVNLPDKVSIGLYFYFIFLFICGKFHSRLFDSCGKVFSSLLKRHLISLFHTRFTGPTPGSWQVPGSYIVIVACLMLSGASKNKRNIYGIY